MGFLIILIIVALVIYCLLEYNNLTMISESTKEKYEDMDEKMKKRWDIIPKFLDIARIYLKDEKILIREIDQITGDSYNSLIASRKRDADIELTEKMSELMKKVEIHPELAMNPKFNKLLSELKNIEENLSEARQKYNEDAKLMNKKVHGFPSSLIAKIFNFNEQVIFE